MSNKKTQKMIVYIMIAIMVVSTIGMGLGAIM